MKSLHKVSTLILALAMMFSMVVSASAKDSNSGVIYGDPIRIIEYVDENGNEVVEKIYFAPNPGSSILPVTEDGDISIYTETSGEGWYRKEKNINKFPDETIMIVEAYFVWGNGDVSVSKASGWIEGWPSTTSTTIEKEDVTTGTGNFALVFNKYAYAEYTISLRNYLNWTETQSVKVTVSQSGNVS